MTPTDFAYTQLYNAASVITEKVATGATLTLDDYAALAKAVHAIDTLQFEDWWEREQASKQTRTQEPR